jgi:hypothetical protein
MAKRSITQKERQKPLANIGPISMMWLRTVGVENLADLERQGIEEVFRQTVLHGFPVSVLMLYGLEGALQEVHWNAICDTRKAELRALAKRIKEEMR